MTFYLSASRISSMQRCPQAFLYRYGEGLIQRPKWVMSFGSAFDHGLNDDYSQKIETHSNLDTEDVVMRMVDNFETRVRDEEPTWDEGIEVDGAKDQLADTARVFHHEVSQYLQPTLSQHEVSMGFDDVDWGLLGYVDVVGVMEGDGRTRKGNRRLLAIDNKTTGKAGGWRGSDVAASYQPVIYDMALRHEGVEPDAFEFHVAQYRSGGRWMKTKKTQRLMAPVDPAARRGMLKLLPVLKQRHDAIIQSGVAEPRYGWQCKGCGYRDKCAKEWGREPPR